MKTKFFLHSLYLFCFDVIFYRLGICFIIRYFSYRGDELYSFWQVETENGFGKKHGKRFSDRCRILVVGWRAVSPLPKRQTIKFISIIFFCSKRIKNCVQNTLRAVGVLRVVGCGFLIEIRNYRGSVKLNTSWLDAADTGNNGKHASECCGDKKRWTRKQSCVIV